MLAVDRYALDSRGTGLFETLRSPVGTLPALRLYILYKTLRGGFLQICSDELCSTGSWLLDIRLWRHLAVRSQMLTQRREKRNGYPPFSTTNFLRILQEE